ncbi:MAG: phosphoribosylanthranilate isomerase [Desulfovibrio sp.]
MLIKFCGITRQQAADVAQRLGADFCGFIFHPKSPRYIGPESAANIATGNASRVGVFVKQDAAEIIEIMQKARLDFAQLHGDQDIACAKAIGPNIIRALWPARYGQIGQILVDAEKFAPYCQYFLLDSGKAGGGHGKATDLASLAGLELPRPYFLAGGLNTDNIRLALARCAPAGLDLNSGVEDAPGVKNAAKMAECARIARNIETNFQH